MKLAPSWKRFNKCAFFINSSMFLFFLFFFKKINIFIVFTKSSKSIWININVDLTLVLEEKIRGIKKSSGRHWEIFKKTETSGVFSKRGKLDIEAFYLEFFKKKNQFLFNFY